MYKNTMYISTITSSLHSQWQSHIAIKKKKKKKKSHCEFDPHNNSVLGAEHRTKIILSTEHQYKNNFVTPKQRKLWKKNTNSETIFHSNSSWQVSRQLLKLQTINLIWFWTFFYENWCYQNCKHCIATVFWFLKQS